MMLKEFSFFLKHPILRNPPLTMSIGNSILLITKMILLYFGLAILTSIIFLPILKLLNLLPEKGLALSQIPLSFKLILFVPIYEEIVFRLPLKFSGKNLFFSLAGLHFMLFYHTYSITVLFVISLTIASVPMVRLLPQTFYNAIELIWKKYFPYLFYCFALGFGFIHMSNFQNLRIAHYFLFPVIVSNQILMGLIFGYVRVVFKNGFIYSVLLHFFINLPLILISHI